MTALLIILTSTIWVIVTKNKWKLNLIYDKNICKFWRKAKIVIWRIFDRDVYVESHRIHFNFPSTFEHFFLNSNALPSNLKFTSGVCVSKRKTKLQRPAIVGKQNMWSTKLRCLHMTWIMKKMCTYLQIEPVEIKIVLHGVWIICY